MMNKILDKFFLCLTLLLLFPCIIMVTIGAMIADKEDRKRRLDNLYE